MERTKNILATTNLSVGYKNKELVTDINLSIDKGDLIALMGLNGTGKTSFFKTVLGEINPLKGEVLINNTNVNQLKIEDFISVVYTDKIDIFGLTVYDIISLGRLNKLNWLGKLKKEDEQIIDNYISLLGLEGIKKQEVNSLSDGQLQKVMIGRALAQDTPIILLDEPTAFLDVKNKKIINELLKKLTEVENKTIIVSTHDIDFANTYCNKALLIKNKKIENYLGSEINEQLFG
jgi:iron complex transport system ATP-binding protein